LNGAKYFCEDCGDDLLRIQLRYDLKQETEQNTSRRRGKLLAVGWRLLALSLLISVILGSLESFDNGVLRLVDSGLLAIEALGSSAILIWLILEIMSFFAKQK
jgi:hypothetical protein